MQRQKWTCQNIKRKFKILSDDDLRQTLAELWEIRASGFCIAIYTRVSTEEQAENPEGSIKNQEQRLREFIDLVLVTEISRFSRSTKDFTMLRDFLDEHECRFLSMRENFDTSGAAGSMVLNMMATVAEFERRQTAERISNSFLARAKRGLYNGGSLP